MAKHNDLNAPPCKNMEALLQQVADGSATGIKKFYAIAHASQCNRCGSFLQRLKITLEVLRESKNRSGSAPKESLERLKAKIKILEDSN
ncbi:MAG: hypothetical protein ACKVQS_11125 [Fimbriimonadaceae bacterium]